MISIDDFQKIELRVGKILTVEKVPETDKLLRLTVDFGLKPSLLKEGSSELEIKEEVREVRQIVSGIAGYFPIIEDLVGKKCMFVTNLEPRMIKGLQSNGMILALSTEDGKFSLLEPKSEIPEGTKAR